MPDLSASAPRGVALVIGANHHAGTDEGAEVFNCQAS